jgi:hypothetical protein
MGRPPRRRVSPDGCAIEVLQNAEVVQHSYADRPAPRSRCGSRARSPHLDWPVRAWVQRRARRAGVQRA